MAEPTSINGQERTISLEPEKVVPKEQTPFSPARKRQLLAAAAAAEEEKDTEPKPRIVITHLVLMNFKSYAGRQEVGPFHSVGASYD